MMFHILPQPPLQARSCLQCLSTSLNSLSLRRTSGRIRIYGGLLPRGTISTPKTPRELKQVRHASTSTVPTHGGRNPRQGDYFTFNSVWKRDVNSATAVGGRAMAHRVIAISTATTTPGEEDKAQAVDLNDILPHRRRKIRKQLEENEKEDTMPLDASSRLTEAVAGDKLGFKRTAAAYLALSKPRLAALVVLTAMASYALYPDTPHIPPVPSQTALSALTLLGLSVGTSLCIASANALNMFFERDLDAKMSRTRNRPLVRGLLSGRQAVIFAVLTGVAGIFVLAEGVNPTVAGLGASNIWLYSFVYTPMKQLSVANTWVGALVGAIPPLMGWAAAAGAVTASPSSAGTEATDDILSTIQESLQTSWEVLTAHPGGLLLGALLFAWQFPHFMAFSHMTRQEYLRAGHKMLAISNPSRNARVALRYSIAFFPICYGLYHTGVTNGYFVLTSSVANTWLVYESVRFWKHAGEKGTARRLFWVSVWHLPVLLVLAMAHKQGLVRGIWDGLWGEGEEEEEDVYDEG